MTAAAPMTESARSPGYTDAVYNLKAGGHRQRPHWLGHRVRTIVALPEPPPDPGPPSGCDHGPRVDLTGGLTTMPDRADAGRRRSAFGFKAGAIIAGICLTSPRSIAYVLLSANKTALPSGLLAG